MSAPHQLDALDVAMRVAAAIESVGGSYFIGGSVASSIQGEPRATNDVDTDRTNPRPDCRARAATSFIYLS
jgi:hypothetical protein